MRKKSESAGLSLLQPAAVAGLLWGLTEAADAQEKRTKARIFNAEGKL